ncbi:MAG: hypothetical protein KAI06_09335 [Anaerolineales bacterium]|nr:hypothetical protein [Anaerolineales bacterium]
MMPEKIHQLPDRSTLPPLPAQAEEIVSKIECGEILGASRSIRLLNEVFCMLADEASHLAGEELAGQLRMWADYLIATRGALSPAVGNAIRSVFDKLDQAATSNSGKEVQSFVHESTEAFNRRSLEDVLKIAAYGANLLQQGDTVMAYDYSSSVTAVLKKAAENDKTLHVIIPESRSLDGGLPILREVLECGHSATFTVDAAIGQELRNCSSVFVGVESLCADGGFWTTVGTCSTAILARHHHVPFYVPTELIKFDPRSAHGIHRTTVRVELECFDLNGFRPPRDRVRYECDDLEYTPRRLITAYITEEGVLPPATMSSVLREKYAQSF